MLTIVEIRYWRFRLANNFPRGVLERCIANPQVYLARDFSVQDADHQQIVVLMRDELERREKARRDV